MENITVFTGKLEPRSVQLLRRKGFIACVIPSREREEGIYLLEDIDGSKIIALYTEDEAPSLRESGEIIQKAFNMLTDVPVIKIEGSPCDADSAEFDGLYVSKSNIVLKNIEKKDELILEFFETMGQETDCEFICSSPEFGFRALFSPYEIKRFYIASDGTVTEKF